MDKKIANNVVLGAFVLAGLSVICFFIFNIGGAGGPFSSNFELKAKFKKVKGLHAGSEVSLSGLRVGVISDITISEGEDKLLIIHMSVQKSVKDRIRKDSVAKIRTQGVLGDKYVELSIGSVGAEPVESGYMLSSAEEADLLKKSGDVIEGISRQFERGGNVEKLIGNLNGLLQDIRTNRGVMHAFVYGDSGTKLNRSLTSLASILNKVDQGKGTIGSLINDPTVYEDVKDLFGGAKRSSILKYFIREFVGDNPEVEKKKPKSSKNKKDAK